MSETPKQLQYRKSIWSKFWDPLTVPSAALTDSGEQRIARLAASFLLSVALFALAVGLARFAMTGISLAAAFSEGIAFTLIPTLVAYALTRTRVYRAGIFLFSIAYAAIAYSTMLLGGEHADSALLILMHVPLSLIIASAFLSAWAVFLLTGLNVAALIAVPLFSGAAPDELAVEAGMITIIGLVLIGLVNFQQRIESLRLRELELSSHKLADISANLELRVQERTEELEAANRQLTRRAAQLQATTDLAETIAQLQDLNEILPVVTRLISEYFGFYHVGIFLIDPAREFAILQAANSEDGMRMLERGHRLRLGTGVVGYCAQTGTPRIALDVARDTVYFDNPDLPQTRSEAAIPMKSRGETIGVLDVQSQEAAAFGNEDLQVLTTLATQVAIALENVRLLTETRAALRQVQEVYDEFTRAEWSRTISKADQPGFRYRDGRIEMLEKLLGFPEIVFAVQNAEIARGTTSGPEEKRSTVAVPVKLRGEVIGVIHVESNDQSKTWVEDEITLVEAVAERAAFAMENARLFQDARRRAAKEQMISQAATRISTTISMENILHATAEELERVLGGSEVLIRFQSKE
jgi:GAF domain-containing protein